MRSIPLLCLAALLGSCAMAPQPEVRSMASQQKIASLLAGRVAAQPTSCVPNYNANDMTVIDGRAVAFEGGGRVYMMELTEGCSLLGEGSYAMVTRQYGGMGLCRGDIVQVADITNRITVGSCTVGAIVPYARIRR